MLKYSFGPYFRRVCSIWFLFSFNVKLSHSFHQFWSICSFLQTVTFVNIAFHVPVCDFFYFSIFFSFLFFYFKKIVHVSTPHCSITWQC